MAMDKEKLLAYFQEHYLSRQEVLFKLPLNYSIDAFWPELLNRRKAKASVLPLYNAAGMPYWYVLTRKMVEASERLCEEAISQDSPFDPYRAEMTSAMTEEMFFTSFVEGAQIPLQEAMDFLSRGTEPESIQEQMIWNNRHAWSEMVAGLYRSLDEPFVKGLAWMLTEEMDGCAEDYRQIDSHPIAAMNSEPYDVPPAYSIPERMGQYYAFLQSTDTHPLIKAAVAAGYLLVARPFPEGNERLSRMMSSAVLLRCGYDFFRDISISSVIARENYRYYKAMCEILRPENGGDMTYFMEYYLELLSRAVDDRKERLRRRQREALEKERELAMAPLEPPGTVPERREEAPEKSAAPDPPSERDEELLVVGEHLPMERFLAEVDTFENSTNPKARLTPGFIRSMIAAGTYTFTVQQWADHTNQPNNLADHQCRTMFRKGLLDRDKRGAVMTYTFRVAADRDGGPFPDPGGEDAPRHPDGADAAPPRYDRLEKWIESAGTNREGSYQNRAAEFLLRLLRAGAPSFTSAELVEQAGLSKAEAKTICNYLVRRQAVANPDPNRRPAAFRLPRAPVTPEEDVPPSETQERAMVKEAFRKMMSSPSGFLHQAGETVCRLLEQGQDTFLRSDWPQLTGIDRDRANDTCDVMLRRGIIVSENPLQRPARYRIAVTLKDLETAEPEPRPVAAGETAGTAAPRAVTVQEQRIAQFIGERTAAGRLRFTSEEWKQYFSIGHNCCHDDLRNAVAKGLITKTGLTRDHYVLYEINPSPAGDVCVSGMTKTQKEMLQAIQSAFGSDSFTISECADRLSHDPSAVGYYMKLFVNRGMADHEQHGTKPGIYTLRVSPQTHPDCFLPLKAVPSPSPVPGAVPMAASGARSAAAVL